MNKLSIVAVAALVLLSASPAFAAQSDEKKDDQERKICKPEQDSVSRIAKKICKTRAQWDQISKDSLNATNVEKQR